MLYLSPWLTAYLVSLTALLGLVLGSFCNAWAWRLVHGESITHGRSHCPACGHPLSPPDLVPLFSWLCLRGRCRYCKAPISPRYPAVELISGLCFVSLLLRFGLSWSALRLMLCCVFLLPAALVDLDTMELPDGLLLAAACTALLRLPQEGLSGLGDALLGGFAVAGGLLALVLVFDRVLKRESMGGGDIKLVFVLGLHFGPAGTLFLLIAGACLGLVFALLTHRGRGTEFPFGPALILAGWLTALVGDSLVGWYLSLF